jgi:hypothetical protein
MEEVRRLSFVEQVRRGELKAPTQPGFRLERWSSFYSAIESPSVSEKQLYGSGVWFVQKLDQIGDLLVRYQGVRMPGNYTVQAHVGAANQMILNDTQLHQDEIESSLEGEAGGPREGVYSPGAYSNVQFYSRLRDSLFLSGSPLETPYENVNNR